MTNYNNRTSLDILVPTYNRARSVSKLINFILRKIQKAKVQTKIIVSDNCSSDNTFIYLKKIKEKNDNLLIYKQKQNIGATNNCEFLVSKSSATYIMFMADDDELNIDVFHEIIECLGQNKDISAVVTPVAINNKKTDKYQQAFDTIKYITNQQIACANEKYKYFFYRGLTLSGILIKRACCDLKIFNEQFRTVLYPQLFFLGQSFLYGTLLFVKKPLVNVNIGNPQFWNYNPDFCNTKIFELIKYFSRSGKINKSTELFLYKTRVLKSFSMLWNVRINHGQFATFNCWKLHLKIKYFRSSAFFHGCFLFCFIFPVKLRDLLKCINQKIINKRAVD